MRPRYVSALLALAVLAGAPARAQFTNGQGAAVVLGQPDFATTTAGATDAKLNRPAAVAFDPATGKVFVADYSNNRVLRFASAAALANGSAAEAVLGQPNLTTTAPATTQAGMSQPVGLALDGQGRLYVSEVGNNRVVRFDGAATKANGANADGVLGQTTFTNGTSATAQGRMYFPWGLAVDGAGRLYVADYRNSRVLRFDGAATKANGANADGVLGQTTFTTGTAARSQSAMNQVNGVAVDGAGRLYVSDRNNRRVLRFDNAAAKANGANADGVLGQADFTAFVTSPVSAARMSSPFAVAVDNGGRVYVADFSYNRVVWFNDAATKANGADADGVLGQADFTTTGSAAGSAGVNGPYGLGVDNGGRLFVADYMNNRTLSFASAGGLPVELVSFTATASGEAVHLRWATASETNNAGFHVERQTGAAWAAAGFVAGRGTTAERQSYAHSVGGLTAGTHRFRLRQVDLDGTAHLSAEVEVAVAPVGPFALAPTSGRALRLVVREPQAIDAGLYDVAGRRVATLARGEVAAGAPVELAAPSGLAPGVYVVRVAGERFHATRTVVVR